MGSGSGEYDKAGRASMSRASPQLYISAQFPVVFVSLFRIIVVLVWWKIVGILFELGFISLV